MKKQVKNSATEDLKKQVEEFKNKYFRALADYQNLEKRAHEHRTRFIKTANNDFIIKLLPFLDNLEKAEVFVKNEGLKIAKDQLTQILKEAGLEEIEILGKSFDPNFAEAIEVIPGEKDNIVVEVLRKGYKLGDKILRVAQVKVSKKLPV